ncbi:uncharacterized protein IL334_005550 [Kwoniella shivajii]|uniref:Uncharacterized protein n=1 Tax=Kwoniella shivajii TaxID=564305 RepID=A0ABZ1D3G2_9TREE|nr:hypothetical protein IL334_005550 [Kwoniella shivajii]
MSSIINSIQSSSQRNAELLSILSETDHASPSLNQQRSYISQLESQLRTIDNQLKKSNSQREFDLKEHKKYSESVFRRFAYKASGQKDKFNEKANKEEKDYFDSLRESQNNENQKSNLKDSLEQAKLKTTHLESIVSRHDQTQKELDELYNSIFNGNTPSFPEEDVLENKNNSALKEYQCTRHSFECEKKTIEILQSASESMKLALGSMKDALSYSTWDMWGGGSMSDMMERNALSTAERYWSNVQMLNQQAKFSSPYVNDLPKVDVAMGNIMSDVFFDNIFTDMAFHDKIEHSNRDLNIAADALERNLQEAQIRYDQIAVDLKGKEKRLEDARRELQNKRSEIFNRVANQ